ncbi:MAG: hypothetical protein R3C20_06415 [Planctomycetaceae bacterium]
MTLVKRGDYWYGDNHADIRSELERYSDRNAYPVDDFTDIRCDCGNDTFHFLTDENAGVAIRRCSNCGCEHLMGDSADFVDEAEPSQHECICEGDVFQITAGIHRYRNQDDSLSHDVRWLYLGCHCPTCGLVGCYADWKNEYNGYTELLAKM